MDLIEFLEKTEQKNIQSFIGVKVKKKLLEYENTLNERRKKLRDILAFENVQHNEELVLLAKEKLEEQMTKRLNWINTKSMERIQAEKELLELKHQQRELENCESWRHFQTKQLLLDSKKGQLYQIADKRLRIEKEKLIERMWHDVMQRLNNEREYQEIYANKLIKVIEQTNQFCNQEIDDNNKTRQEEESRQNKKEFQEENQKAIRMEEKLQKDEESKKFLNKIHQEQMLKSQILANCERKTLEIQLQLKEARAKNEIENQKMYSELEQNERERIYNNEWQKCYIRNSHKEKQEEIKEQMDFERMYINTGCVLQQRPKKPYRKSTR